MQFLFTNLKIKPTIFFIFIAICFCIFILFCSILYPFTSDEVRFMVMGRENLLQTLKLMFFGEAPRFFNFVVITGLYFGVKYKVFFCLINPIIQISIVYCLFYFIKGRKLNLKDRADLLPFMLISLACLFMVSGPSMAMFDVNGAALYSWVFLFCLALLCLYRFTYKGCKLKNTWYINLFWLVVGFVAGMSNENTSPMMIGISLSFILLCKYKKIKVPSYIYCSFLGIIFGVSAMFGFGGSAQRLKGYVYTFFVNAGIGEKLFYSLPRFNAFLKALYFIPIIVLIGLILIFYDIKKKAFREKFILSAFFLFCGFLTAFVLFAAPLVPARAYYSASMFCIISFCFFLDFFYDVYKIYILKYFTLLFLIYCLIISPFVLLSYFSLYKNFKARDTQIYLAKSQGKTKVCTDIIYTIPAPTKNLTIEYLDFVKHHSAQHKETLKKWYGIEVIVPDETNFSFINKNPLIPHYKVKLDNHTK